MRTRRRTVALTVGLLVAVFALLAVTSMWGKSATFDEGFYLAGGYSYWRTGDPTMANWFNPVLGPMIVGAPLLTMDLEEPQETPGWPDNVLSYASAFLYDNRSGTAAILHRGRLPVIALGLLLLLGVFLWSRELFGNAAGLLSLLLCVFSPNILAHSRLATTDLPLTVALFWATFLFHRQLRRPSLTTAVTTGLLLGSALAIKVSALLVLPGWAVLWLLYEVRPAHRESGDSARKADRGPAARVVVAAGRPLVIAVFALLVVAVVYRFDFHRQAMRSVELQEGAPINFQSASLTLFQKVSPWLPLPTGYLQSVRVFLDTARNGHPGFLFGQVRTSGWWYFFPVVWALKTPVGTLLLVLTAVALAPWSARPRWTAEILTVPSLFLAGCMTSSVNIGFRHILPIVPFLLVMVGSLATVRLAKVRLLHALIAILAAWTVSSSARVYPDYLAYFNELAGGSAGGIRCLGDSNLDWGQDVDALAGWIRANDIKEPLHVNLHTLMPTEKLGIPTLPFPQRGSAEPGWYAISATALQNIYDQDHPERVAWLKTLKPVAVLHRTIFVFHLMPGDRNGQELPLRGEN